ncbi:hypothetical protein GGQ84_001477 [Desulfitispora alkaliphila]|uniref:DUF4911 domain-containing protein n=1 Tax=Desulfitispora alkaliphila TaxID=622674 RepID=UPI003D1A781F
MNKDEINDPLKILVLLEPSKIVLLDEIIEGYSHLGIVTTISGKKGVAMVQVTADTKGEVLKILENMPCEIKIISFQEAEKILDA